MLLTGTYTRRLDEKHRVAVPKRLRQVMDQGGSGPLFVAPGLDASLVIYPEVSFQRLAQRLAEAPPTQQDVRAFGRLFYAQAEQVEPDAQGRIRIPQRLAEQARLSGEVIMIGVQDHLEVWSRDRWDAYLAEKAANYDAIAEAALGNPVPPGNTRQPQ